MSPVNSHPEPYVEAFRQGLRELGYVDGKNIVIEYRCAEGKLERFPKLANELVRLKVDVIVMPIRRAVAAKEATKTIPIVMVTSGILSRADSSLAWRGQAEISQGLSALSPELSGKRLELLKESFQAFPRRRPSESGESKLGLLMLKENEAAARTLKDKLQTLERGHNRFGGAHFSYQGRRAGALIVLTSANLFSTAKTDRGPGGKEPTAVNVSSEGIGRSRRAHDLLSRRC